MPENFTVLAVPDFSKAAFLQLDIPGALHMGLITIIFSFTFVELFDSMGHFDWYRYRGEKSQILNLVNSPGLG